MLSDDSSYAEVPPQADHMRGSRRLSTVEYFAQIDAENLSSTTDFTDTYSSASEGNISRSLSEESIEWAGSPPSSISLSKHSLLVPDAMRSMSEPHASLQRGESTESFALRMRAREKTTSRRNLIDWSDQQITRKVRSTPSSPVLKRPIFISSYTVTFSVSAAEDFVMYYDSFLNFEQVKIQIGEPLHIRRRAVIVPFLSNDRPRSHRFCKSRGKSFTSRVEQYVQSRYLGQVPVGASFLVAESKYIAVFVCVAMSSECYDRFAHYHALRAGMLQVHRYNQCLRSGQPIESPLCLDSAIGSHKTIRKIVVLGMPTLGLPSSDVIRHLTKAYESLIIAEMSKDSASAANSVFQSLSDPVKERHLNEFLTDLMVSHKLRMFVLLRSSYAHRTVKRGLANVIETVALIELFTLDDTRIARLAMSHFASFLTSAGVIDRDLPISVSRPQMCSCLCMRPAAFKKILAASEAREVLLWQVATPDEVAEIKMIGKGGCGSVYKVEWNGVECAMKKFHYEVDPFVREASLMSLLLHPNLVRPLACSDVQNSSNLFVLMELCAAGSLCARIHNNPEPLAVVEMVEYSIHVCRAMAHLHSVSLIHRDIKSANVLLFEYEGKVTAKLIDYGTTRPISKNMTGNVGTSYWIAPEVLEDGRYTEKADIYSMAVLMFEIFSGLMPFQKVSHFEVPHLVMKGKRPSLPAIIPRPIVKLIESCWAQKPGKRPTATALLHSLERFQAEQLSG